MRTALSVMLVGFGSLLAAWVLPMLNNQLPHWLQVALLVLGLALIVIGALLGVTTGLKKPREPDGGNSFNVSSSNQIGGITAGIVSISHERRLDPQAAAQIRRGVAANPGDIQILDGGGGASLAADIRDTFAEAGWETGIGQRIGDNGRGIQLYPHSQSGENAATVIEAAGVSAYRRPLSSGALAGDLTIIIGPA